MDIPVRNLYYLLCYAWDVVGPASELEVGNEDAHSGADLLAKVMLVGIDHVRKIGFERGYREFNEELQALRGRLDFAGTVRSASVTRGRLSCRFDELVEDSDLNRVVKAASLVLARTCSDKSNADQLRSFVRNWEAVSDLKLNASVVRRIRLDRSRGAYRLLLGVCQLVSQCLIPTEKGDTFAFTDFLRDDRLMAQVFQRFLFRFFAREQHRYPIVKVDRFDWVAESENPETLALLPLMETDVTLRSEREVLVVDAKYYSEAFTARYERLKFRSAHLYQLYSYLSNLAIRETQGRALRGMLIYPGVETSFRHEMKLAGFVVEVASVRLDVEWRDIHARLLSLVLS